MGYDLFGNEIVYSTDTVVQDMYDDFRREINEDQLEFNFEKELGVDIKLMVDKAMNT
jgi:hypothetical protein